MSAATSTVLGIIAIGASAGVSAYGAHEASKASRDAADQQSAAADRALKLQIKEHAQTRTDLAPYRETGNTSLSSLSSFLGLPANAPTPAASVPPPLGPKQIPATPPGVPAVAGAVTAARGGQSLSSLGGGGGLVLLRAPNGQTQQVPAEQVAYYVSRGATPV